MALNMALGNCSAKEIVKVSEELAKGLAKIDEFLAELYWHKHEPLFAGGDWEWDEEEEPTEFCDYDFDTVYWNFKTAILEK